MTMFEIMYDAIIAAIARNNGNKTKAAKELDISIRKIKIWTNEPYKIAKLRKVINGRGQENKTT